MSSAICVEVFDWAKLSKAEDNFRSAILALEDGIVSSAKEYLSASAGKDMPNSSALLGIIDLMEGKVDLGMKFLNQASEFNTNIPDAYSALAQIYSQKGDAQRAEFYKKKYTEICGFSNYIPLKIGSIKASADYPLSDSLSFLNDLGANPNVSANDTNANKSQAQNKTKKSDNAPIKEENSFSILPAWISPIWVISGAGILFFLLMLRSSFNKWKKQQIENFTNESAKAQKESPKSKSNFSNELNKANLKKPTQNSIAIEKYKKNAPESVSPLVKAISNRQNEYKEKSQQVKNLAKLILENKNRNDLDSISLNNLGKSKSPKLDLALNLQKKQQKIKKDNLNKFDDSDISKLSNSSAEIAKEFGIEINSVDTKKNLNKLTSDKDELDKLANKIQKNKNNG
jgi:hypothetical protein